MVASEHSNLMSASISMTFMSSNGCEEHCQTSKWSPLASTKEFITQWRRIKKTLVIIWKFDEFFGGETLDSLNAWNSTEGHNNLVSRLNKFWQSYEVWLRHATFVTVCMSLWLWTTLLMDIKMSEWESVSQAKENWICPVFSIYVDLWKSLLKTCKLLRMNLVKNWSIVSRKYKG